MVVEIETGTSTTCIVMPSRVYGEPTTTVSLSLPSDVVHQIAVLPLERSRADLRLPAIEPWWACVTSQDQFKRREPSGADSTRCMDCIQFQKVSTLASNAIPVSRHAFYTVGCSVRVGTTGLTVVTAFRRSSTTYPALAKSSPRCTKRCFVPWDRSSRQSA